MNFIDMLIEYQEELLINKSLTEYDADEEEIENEILGLTDNSEKRLLNYLNLKLMKTLKI